MKTAVRLSKREDEKPVTTVKCGFRLDRGRQPAEQEDWVKLRLCTEVVATGVGRGLKMAYCREIALTIAVAD